MLKKIIFFSRLFIITTIWSYAYFVLCRYAFLYIWKFDILLTKYWVTIAEFWNRGGVINKFKDLLFVISIFSIIPLWIYSLIKLVKFNYVNIIIVPIDLYNKYIMRKYGSGSSRIVFKNLGASRNNMTFEEMVEMKMKEAEKKGEKELEATKIRNIIQDKIKNKK